MQRDAIFHLTIADALTPPLPSSGATIFLDVEATVVIRLDTRAAREIWFISARKVIARRSLSARGFRVVLKIEIINIDVEARREFERGVTTTLGELSRVIEGEFTTFLWRVVDFEGTKWCENKFYPSKVSSLLVVHRFVRYLE